MGGCSAVNCSNRCRNGFRMFRFPRDPERRKRWVINCGRGSWEPGPGAQLCVVHFEESQLENNRADNWKKLKQTAVPTVFDVPSPPVPLANKRKKGLGLPKKYTLFHNYTKSSKENHFSPDQFESNRRDGLVNLKPNTVPTIFYHHKLPVECKAPAEKRKVLKRWRHCSVDGCKSKYISKKGIVRLFPLPSDKRLREKWLRKIPTNISRFKKPVICIKHFRENCIVRTEQFIINGKAKRIERVYPELKPDAVPSIFPKHTTNNRPQKRQRTSRKSCICDNSDEVVNVLDISENSLKGTKGKVRSCKQKSQCAVKKGKAAETVQLDTKQKEIFASSITNMLEVDLFQHMCSVNVKQEPQYFENEEPDGFVNEEFLEHPFVTTACHVIIKEESDLELGVDVVENTVLQEPFETSVCTDNINEEPESTFEATGVEGNVNKFAEAFVPEWCPPSIKKEEVCDSVNLELQSLLLTQ